MSFHRRVVQAILACLAVAASQQALAQVPTLHGLTGIQIEYKEPTNPAHRPVYERLKRRTVLEQYKEFMSPLKFKRLLHVSLSGCNGVVNAFYTFGERRITYCYEYIVHMQRRIAETDVLPGFRREDAIVGEFVNTILHETGHALFDMFDIPLFGREEDAADAVASFVALRVGPMTARRILSGTAFAWRASALWRQKKNNVRSFTDYADEHGTEAQRFYNTLCVALGSDTVERANVFADFVQLLPERRRAKCGREYLHVKRAFARYVLPHVDQDLLQKVRGREWLRSEDGSEATPPGPLGPQGQPPGPTPGPNNPRPPTFSPTPR
jgi:hypothetical protein